jgi:hypothetical protein
MQAPSLQDQRSVGPLPEGTYSIDPTEIDYRDTIIERLFWSPGWGEGRVSLHPNPTTDLFGRDGFFLHGSRNGNGFGSAGCIDLNTDDKRILGLINESGAARIQLVVDYSKNRVGLENGRHPAFEQPDIQILKYVPIGTVSSSRLTGQNGSIPAGSEMNALDVISETNFRNGVSVITPTATASAQEAAGAALNLPYVYPDLILRAAAGITTISDDDDDNDDDGQTTRERIEQIKDEGLSPTAPEPVYRAPVPEIESRTGQAPDDPRYTGPQPILLDLDGNGIRITEQSRSGMFVDAGGDGLKHRTAWAGAGDGVRACRAADRRSGPRQDDRRTVQSAGARRRVIALSRAALPG